MLLNLLVSLPKGLMKTFKIRGRCFVIISMTALFLSCAGTPPVLKVGVLLMPPSTEALWLDTEIPGVRILNEINQNIPVGVAALAVDTALFEFVVTPPDQSGKGETRSSKTSEFALREDVLIALNGSPFDPYDLFNRSNRAMDIIGIHIREGQVISEAVPHYDALYILKNGQIIFDSQGAVPRGTKTALGGYHLLLYEGENLGTNDTRNPRTAIGLSEDRKTFYAAVFDGRQIDRAGMTTEETAAWMRWLGCSIALNMDGGGSSTLVLNENGTVRILNSPIHRGKPGLERAVGNHLGIRQRTP